MTEMPENWEITDSIASKALIYHVGLKTLFRLQLYTARSWFGSVIYYCYCIIQLLYPWRNHRSVPNTQYEGHDCFLVYED